MRDDEIPAAAIEILENVRALEPDIRQSAAAIERERRLPDKLAHQLMEAQVFRLGLPRAYGGPELDPMSQVRIVEELSRIEGSVGWLSMISSAGSFLGISRSSGSATFFWQRRQCVGGKPEATTTR